MKTSKTLSGAEVSRAIKKELTANFPIIKFSVRYSSFSGGDSVHISWDFGPTTKEVEVIVNKYELGKFDGMTDSYNYDRTKVIDGFGEVADLGGVKYVQTSRHISDEFSTQVQKAICAIYNVEHTGHWTRIENQNEYVSTLAHRLLHKASFLTSNPSFVQLAQMPKGCGHFEEFYLVAVTEEVNGATISTDVTGSQMDMLNARLKETETNYYKARQELSEMSTKYYNLQREMQEAEKKRLTPHVLNVADQKIFIADGMYANMNKCGCMEEYTDQVSKGEYYIQKSKVTEVVYATDELYDLLENSLLDSFDFLAGKGGTDSSYKVPEGCTDFSQMNEAQREAWKAQSYNLTILIYHPTKPLFLIDPQGHNYARYVALIPSETQKELREFIEAI